MTDVRRLQAPTEHGRILAAPPLAETGRLLADNRRHFNQPCPDILGRSWAELRRQAQDESLAAAKDYLCQAGEPLPPSQGGTLFLAGHQPDLFHPGVWIKNFALAGLAKSQGATPLNLIVDSDAAKTTSIRVPALAGRASARSRLDPDQVQLLTIPIDRWTREVPYEELHVADETTFANVESQVTPILQAWGFTSMFSPFWQTVMRRSQRTDILGERLAAARRTFERDWGCHNWELPVSRLCQTPSFAWFACHLVAHLPRFQRIYNDSVRSYRERYGLRSRSHPVPELAAENGWLETPFWAWRPDQPRRRPLLARQTDVAIQLRFENEVVGQLPFGAGSVNDRSLSRGRQAVAVWQELEANGFKIRTRALMTTLFARLFLGDLFIHGIGGGKYDELTDAIIRGFYQVEPPAYLVLSGTLHLQLPGFPTRANDCQRLAHDLRDLRWNPQRHLGEPKIEDRGSRIEDRKTAPLAFDPRSSILDPPSSTLDPQSSQQELVARKAEWIARQPAELLQRRERYQMLRRLTTALRAFGKEKERLLHEELIRCHREVQANRVLQSREYAFCLYPAETLRPFCTQFLDESVVRSP